MRTKRQKNRKVWRNIYINIQQYKMIVIRNQKMERNIIWVMGTQRIYKYIID